MNAASKLGEMRTGALIAVKGAEPWDHHMQGGIELGGAISLPLLFSLFDHRTPGHDGALLIEGNRVTKFAVQLPLAPIPPHVIRYGGTRHAAGLGLAEVCDAFIVVVSEERGTISLAHDGADVDHVRVQSGGRIPQLRRADRVSECASKLENPTGAQYGTSEAFGS